MPSASDDVARRRARLSAAQLVTLERRLQEARSSRAREPQIPRALDRRDWPLSCAQERLWFLHHLDPESAAYNRPACFRLTGALDVPTLEQSLAAILRRHAALRVRFSAAHGRPRQVVVEEPALALPVVELAGERLHREETARRLAVAEARRPFDLNGGPLVRGRLLRLSADEHLLLLTFHHAVFDGWSEHILERELALLYAGFRTGEPAPLDELPIQYTDYAVWQREWLEGEAYPAETSYWLRRLEGAPRVLELPADRARRAVRSDRGARLTCRLPASLAESLRSLSQQHEATLFMTLLAAFQVLLHRHARRSEVLIGTPVAGRTRVELEELIGLFVNLVPLRTSIAGTETFQDLLAGVKSTTLEAFAHQELPFEKLVEALVPERSLAQSPLVQVVFQLRNLPSSRVDLPGLAIETVPIETGSSPFDLSVDVTDSADGLSCTAVYSTDLFAEESIRRMLVQYHRLLEQIADDPGRRIGALDLLGAEEWHEFQTRQNRCRSEYPVERTLHELFEAQAARTPNAIALTAGARELTYGELNARANQLARFLRARGVGPEDLVAVTAERSTEAVVGILGILKAGAAYVPVEAAEAVERVTLVLLDARPRAILTEEPTAQQLVDCGVPVIRLDRDWPIIAKQDDTNLNGGGSPAHLAYVIYTSGSTGKPKGVMVEHRQVVRLFEATRDEFQFGAHDVWTLFHSLAFDFSVWELFGALTTGGRLVVVPRETARSPEDFRRLLAEERVTVLNQTPSAFRPLSRAAEPAHEASGPLSLRVVVLGGERLEPGHLKSWMDRHGDDHPRLINMYGITETTVHVTLRRMTRADLEHPTGSLIGDALADLKLLLLDDDRRPVPDGIAGEIYVGGAGLARGYLHRPDLTAERFVADPFDARPEARLYRSGDLARRLPTGELEFLGRADQQVQIRGFRVEPGEVEAVLKAHPQVADAAVVPVGSAPDGPRLIAYVVLRSGQTASVSQLFDRLRRQLPDYMLPTSIVFLPGLPLTPNGKLDRAALPDPAGHRPDLDQPYAAPRTTVESTLAELWGELLEVAPVGVDDNFFELGGHSLLAAQMVARVRDRLHVAVPLRRVFDSPTIRELAAHLCNAGEPDVPPGGQPFGPVARDGRIPVSFGQEQFALLSQLDPDRPVYNESAAIRIAGALDVSVLVRCLSAIGQRHEVLRTNIRADGGQWVQDIRGNTGGRLSVVRRTCGIEPRTETPTRPS